MLMGVYGNLLRTRTRANHGWDEKSPVRCCTQAYVHRTVLISLHSQLRRHRRKATCALAALALGFIGLAAHATLMSSDMGNHMGNTAAVCLAVGGCALFIAVAAFSIRRLLQRPLWLLAAPLMPARPFTPTSAGFPVRAGPASLSQVFRL